MMVVMVMMERSERSEVKAAERLWLCPPSPCPPPCGHDERWSKSVGLGDGKREARQGLCVQTTTTNPSLIDVSISLQRRMAGDTLSQAAAELKKKEEDVTAALAASTERMWAATQMLLERCALRSALGDSQGALQDAKKALETTPEYPKVSLQSG